MVRIRYAGFWIRFLAYLLDGIILGVPAFLLQIGFLLVNMESMMYVVSVGLIMFIVWLDGIKGGTPGKLILGLRIVDKQGKYIGMGNAFLRYIGKFISGIILFIGYLMIAFDKKKQGLHDKIANTYVIYKRG